MPTPPLKAKGDVEDAPTVGAMTPPSDDDDGSRTAEETFLNTSEEERRSSSAPSSSSPPSPGDKKEERHPSAATPTDVRRASLMKRSRGRRSSMELRRVPLSLHKILTGGGGDDDKEDEAEGEGDKEDDTASIASSCDRDDEQNDLGGDGADGARKSIARRLCGVRCGGDGKGDVLQRTCLHPQLPLRTQLLMSFGIVSVVAISSVMITSIVVSYLSGQTVKDESRDILLESTLQKSSATLSRQVAEVLTERLPHDAVHLLRQATLDRFAGYPDAEGYDVDGTVPFYDDVSQTNRYPLESDVLPMDWDLVEHANVGEHNAEEHVGGQPRWGWYEGNPLLSTRSSLYHVQGACDPTETDPNALGYYANCTEDNNDHRTGGVVAPTDTNYLIATKAADLDIFLKPLFEYHQSIKEIGVFFSNSGAGSSLMFPHYAIDGTGSYTSTGCKWMRQPNPYDPTRPIGTDDHIRRCHQQGDVVPSREYNPLERNWCSQQALDPHRVHTVGPYLDAWSDRVWLLTIGQAVYDRITNEFVACLLVDIEVDSLVSELIWTVVDGPVSDSSTVTIVHWDDDGTVLASPHWNASAAVETTSVRAAETHYGIDLGIDVDIFERAKSLVDFAGGTWDPQRARELFFETTFERDGSIVTVSPVPSIPDVYDERYEPEFMVLILTDKSEVLAAADQVDEDVDDEVRDLVTFTLLVGFSGLIAVVALIYFVSLQLSKPLTRIDSTATKILHNHTNAASHEGGEDEDKGEDGIDYKGPTEKRRCSPHTELTILEKEFEKMVAHFSGAGESSAVKNSSVEVKNQFEFCDEFASLYQSRQDKDFKFGYGPSVSSVGSNGANGVDASGKESSESPALSARRRHWGENVRADESQKPEECSVPVLKELETRRSVLSSPLFWWMLGLIVTPLLVTTVTISAVVTWKVSTQLPDLVDPAKVEYIELERTQLSTATKLKVAYASEVTETAVRNLHLLSRATEWLLFGAVKRRTSFTQMVTGAEDCKYSPEKGSCAFYDDMYGAPCDCAWGERGAENCRAYPSDIDTRYLQKQFYECQSLDTLPHNGDRNSTRYPENSFSPNTTGWWNDTETVPGNLKGSNASGVSTTYDRLRVLSALSVVMLPLYNYDVANKMITGTYVGFEADGAFLGYSGCNHGHVDYPFWVSSESNGAAKLREDLCPEGKYGYDPRCRDWYDTGKNASSRDGDPLYLTAPYRFASTGNLGQSCTLPLIDPYTSTHVGQTLVDFISTPIFNAFKRENTPLSSSGFPILITLQTDVLGSDVLLGPGSSLGNPSLPIEESVLPHDRRNCYDDDCTNWLRFQTILQNMRAGDTGDTSFERLDSDGVSETLYISYAPVSIGSLHSMNASDFSRGVKRIDSLVYSLALVEPERSMLEDFTAVEDTLQKQSNISTGVLVGLIAVATLLVIYISDRVAISILRPTLNFLRLIQLVNTRDLKAEALTFDEGGGSKEVASVCKTFEMLQNVVRYANAAYFTGEIEVAYKVFTDALSLFKRLGDEKAIGVASNNLGIVMLSMYQRMEVTGESNMCGLSKEQIIAKGMALFQKAIKNGEEAYDIFYEKEGWSKSCLGFMQHLSNRYFNRAMFLLTVSKDHEKHEELKVLGFRDLEIVRNMDIEIVDMCLEVGFAIIQEDHFEVVLSRIRGLLSLIKMSYDCEEWWGLEELIEEALKALRNSSSDIFGALSLAGRMQQLDELLIDYVDVCGNGSAEGARIAIRMLVEDEYILLGSQLRAIQAIQDYICSAEVLRSDSTKTYQELGKELDRVLDALTAEAVRDSMKRQQSRRRSSRLEIGKTINATSDSRSIRSTRGSASSLNASLTSSVVLEAF